jgi:hypothetical protein
MIAAIFLAILVQDPTSTYTDGDLNVAFDYPKAWNITKRDKRLTEWKVPIDGSTDTGMLQLVRATYRGEPELWQTIQLRSAEIGKRRVVRQWSQDIIGTPLLCTQLEYDLQGIPTTELSALYYRSGAKKMLVRLVTPTSAFDNTKYRLQQVLESLRTIDGSAPKAEDPSQPLPVVGPKPDPVRPIKVLPTTEKPKFSVGKQSLALRISERDVVLRYPEAWVAESSLNGDIKLSTSGLSGTATLHAYSLLDSPVPEQAINGLTSKSLDRFVTVSHREDASIEANRAGAKAWIVWRIGKTEVADLATIDAVCASSDFYFTLTFSNANRASFAQDRALILKFLDRASLSIAP